MSGLLRSRLVLQSCAFMAVNKTKSLPSRSLKSKRQLVISFSIVRSEFLN